MFNAKMTKKDRNCNEKNEVIVLSNTNPKGMFKKGDLRASEGGKKGKCSPDRGVTLLVMDKIREMASAAEAALRAGLEIGDNACMKMIFDRQAHQNQFGLTPRKSW